MNAETFLELMNTLPDEMIVTAVHAEYKRKRMPVYLLPAAAACLVIGLAAAVYPKLRMHTPEVTEPPAVTAETTSPVMTAPVTTLSKQAVTTGTETARTQTTAAATVTVYTTAVTEPAETEPVETEPPETDISVTSTDAAVETPAFTEQHIETTTHSVIPVIIEDPVIEVPLWKGIVMYQESVAEPHLNSFFALSPNDMDVWMRSLFGISQDYDLTQNRCLLITIDTAYSNAVIIGCKQVPNGLTLIVAYLEDGKELNKTIHYAIPLPDNMTLEPDNCNADYLEMTDEELIQEMEKEKLELKTGNEQEGLQ